MKKSRDIIFRIADEDVDKLDLVCMYQGEGRSEVLRKLIRKAHKKLSKQNEERLAAVEQSLLPTCTNCGGTGEVDGMVIGMDQCPVCLGTKKEPAVVVMPTTSGDGLRLGPELTAGERAALGAPVGSRWYAGRKR